MENRTLIESLKLSIEVLGDFLDKIPEAAQNQVRGEGYWSINKHVNHLALTQIMLCRRIELFMKEENPVIKPYIPSNEEDTSDSLKPAQELLATFAKWREKQIVLIEQCGEGVWKREALHPEYTEYSFDTLVRHILLHDYYHMNRMEELWLLRDEYIKPQ
jgi:uncharacterized damage-inducible protein DinB